MSYFIYILKSINYSRFYIGMTQDINERIAGHNRGNTRSTKPYRPYYLVYQERYNTYKEAASREKQIKS